MKVRVMKHAFVFSADCLGPAIHVELSLKRRKVPMSEILLQIVNENWGLHIQHTESLSIMTPLHNVWMIARHGGDNNEGNLGKGEAVESTTRRFFHQFCDCRVGRDLRDINSVDEML